jgi:hypothetical protein
MGADTPTTQKPPDQPKPPAAVVAGPSISQGEWRDKVKAQLQPLPAEKDPAKDARRLVDLSGGQNPVVKLDATSKAQLERIAAGPPPGKSTVELTRDGRTLEIGANQAKALSVLSVLAEKTAERRTEPGHGSDVLEIVSYVRFGDAKHPQGKHGEGVAFDIAAYGGHRFDETRPAESRAAVKALVADLPAGHYGLGLPRLPTKFPIPEDRGHLQKYAEDVGAHPEAYQRDPGGGAAFELTRRWGDSRASSYAVVHARPTEALLKAEDPHFRQPQTVAEVKPFGDVTRLDAGTAAVIREAAKDRQAHITPFADGFGHAHLSVVLPGATSF